MSWTRPRILASILCCSLAVAGCVPHPPAYWNDQGSLTHYLDQATALEHPDLETAILDEVTQSRPPITVANPDFESFWDLTLEEAVSIALQNSKVIRGYGTPALQGNRVAPGLDNLTNGPAGAGTVYNVAVRESEPGFIGTPGQIANLGNLVTNTALDANQGVEAALADFDAQFTTSLFWDKSDTPRNTLAGDFQPDPVNNPFNVTFFQQDSVNFQAQLAKRTAEGTQLFLRHTANYTDNNIPIFGGNPPGFQALKNIYQAALEFEVRQPLLRGRGAFVNRMPVVIARIGADQELANLESQLQNMVTNVEIRYWDLYGAYRSLEAAKYGRDATLATWRVEESKYREGTLNAQDEAQAREQYYFFEGEVKRAWAELLDTESNLRFLLGIAATDGRLIRPIDEPMKAPVEFDYGIALDEAVTLRPELRQERWEVKKRQLGVAYAKNSLLPNLNAVAQYRWLGLGDELISYDDPAPAFPQADSGAWNDLLSGDYQEFRVGLEYAAPVGFRREMANVTNAQVKLARELARLEELELDVTRELQHALRALKTNYHLAQSNFNRLIAVSVEVEKATDRYQEGVDSRGDSLDRLLDAQRRRSQAELLFYQSLVEYNKVIALVHRRKGTVLNYCGVMMDEGPWAGKAYCDAAEYARKRGASTQLNYGWTRPEVISRGELDAASGEYSASFDDTAMPFAAPYYESSPSPTPAQAPAPTPADELYVPTESFQGDSTLEPSMDESTHHRSGAPQSQVTDSSTRRRATANSGGYVSATLHATTPEPAASLVATSDGEADGNSTSRPAPAAAKIKWEKMGLSQPASANGGSSAAIRQANRSPN